jgi:hypothetical protein
MVQAQQEILRVAVEAIALQKNKHLIDKVSKLYLSLQENKRVLKFK